MKNDKKVVPIIVVSYTKNPCGTKTGACRQSFNKNLVIKYQISGNKKTAAEQSAAVVLLVLCAGIFFCCFAPQAVQIFHRFCSQSLCFKLSFTNFLPEADHLPPHRANAQEADQEQDRADETNFPPFRLGNITGAEVNGSRTGGVMG